MFNRLQLNEEHFFRVRECLANVTQFSHTQFPIGSPRNQLCLSNGAFFNELPSPFYST